MVKFGEVVANKTYGTKEILVNDQEFNIAIGSFKKGRVGKWLYHPFQNFFQDETELTQILAKLKELNG